MVQSVEDSYNFAIISIIIEKRVVFHLNKIKSKLQKDISWVEIGQVVWEKKMKIWKKFTTRTAVKTTNQIYIRIILFSLGHLSQVNLLKCSWCDNPYLNVKMDNRNSQKLILRKMQWCNNEFMSIVSAVWA